MLIFVYQFGSLSVNGQPERRVELWSLLSCSGLPASDRPGRCIAALPGGNGFFIQFDVIKFSVLIPPLICQRHPILQSCLFSGERPNVVRVVLASVSSWVESQ